MIIKLNSDQKPHNIFKLLHNLLTHLPRTHLSSRQQYWSKFDSDVLHVCSNNFFMQHKGLKSVHISASSVRQSHPPTSLPQPQGFHCKHENAFRRKSNLRNSNSNAFFWCHYVAMLHRGSRFASVFGVIFKIPHDLSTTVLPNQRTVFPNRFIIEMQIKKVATSKLTLHVICHL